MPPRNPAPCASNCYAEFDQKPQTHLHCNTAIQVDKNYDFIYFSNHDFLKSFVYIFWARGVHCNDILLAE